MGGREENYRVVYRGGRGEIVEKKSRFIATVRPVYSEEAACAFIGEMKKKYWDASHNCSAFVVGEKNFLTRCSDDGEPGQTAGRPMLDVLMGEGIINAAVVVTRYFGGTLLGTGGLARAYSRAVREGLGACVIAEKISGIRAECSMDYPDIGKLKYLAEKEGYLILNTEYGEKVSMNLLFPEEGYEAFGQKIREAFSGRMSVTGRERVSYGIVDKKPVFFDGLTDNQFH